MDRQNRVGSKFGGGGVSSAQQSERERKERLKTLALESIDLAKDPFLVRNHLGSYECKHKLCLTLHRDESNYLAHTQGRSISRGLLEGYTWKSFYKRKEERRHSRQLVRPVPQYRSSRGKGSDRTASLPGSEESRSRDHTTLSIL